MKGIVGLSKRNWMMMLTVAGLGIGYLLLLGYLLWGNVLGLRAAATTASPTPTYVAIDLWGAYERACTAARGQAADAQLVSASTRWQGVGKEALLNGATGWTFVFYSAAGGDALDVVVDAGVGRVVNQAQVWVAPKTIAEGKWQAGPRDVLLAFLAYGGQAFLDEHPQALVDLHLAEGDEGGAAWAIVALDPEERGLLALVVDAETMQVLLSNPDSPR